MVLDIQRSGSCSQNFYHIVIRTKLIYSLFIEYDICTSTLQSTFLLVIEGLETCVCLCNLIRIRLMYVPQIKTYYLLFEGLSSRTCELNYKYSIYTFCLAYVYLLRVILRYYTIKIINDCFQKCLNSCYHSYVNQDLDFVFEF